MSNITDRSAVAVPEACPLSAVPVLSAFCTLTKEEQRKHCNLNPTSDECLYQCYPFDKEESIIVGSFCITNSLVGLMGNLLTLLAIPYARKKNR